jgi:hypothetical protein
MRSGDASGAGFAMTRAFAPRSASGDHRNRRGTHPPAFARRREGIYPMSMRFLRSRRNDGQTIRLRRSNDAQSRAPKPARTAARRAQCWHLATWAGTTGRSGSASSIDDSLNAAGRVFSRVPLARASARFANPRSRRIAPQICSADATEHLSLPCRRFDCKRNRRRSRFAYRLLPSLDGVDGVAAAARRSSAHADSPAAAR